MNRSVFAIFRHRPRWRSLTGLGTLLVVVLLSPATIGAVTNAPAQKPALQNLDALKTEVEAILRTQATARWPEAEISVNVTPPAAGAYLVQCTRLNIDPRGSRLYGAIPVSVRCDSPTRWHLYFQSQVEVFLPVLVATAPLRRGTGLNTDNTGLETRKLLMLRADFITNPLAIQGLQSARSLNSGDPIYNSGLVKPVTIAKGHRITIGASRGPVRIGAKGQALEAGSIGEQIKVRNLQSGREVFAWVVAPGEVSSTWPPPNQLQATSAP